MVDLLPCPFCGSHPESGNGFAATESTVFVWCSNESCYLSPVGRDERFFTVEEWNTRAPPPFPVWELNELAKERDALKAELEAARNQKPCGWQSQFTAIGENWGPCSKEHYETVMSDTSAYPGYEVRQVYASPVPAPQWNLITNENWNIPK
jgi:hypothetical protein